MSECNFKLYRVNVASSTPLLAVYANCRGSMWLATDLISWLHTSLSMHLAMIYVSATGRKSLNSLEPVFLAMGIIVDCFHVHRCLAQRPSIEDSRFCPYFRQVNSSNCFSTWGLRFHSSPSCINTLWIQGFFSSFFRGPPPPFPLKALV